MLGNVFKVYIKPFDHLGNYEADFIDVTKYVKTIGRLQVDTDSSDYQIGVYKNSNFNIVLNNREGLFSDVTSRRSIFDYTRADSLVKVTYQMDADGPWCGMAICGDSYLSEETEIFLGILSDDSLLENARTEEVTFNVLGLESLFQRAIVPFSSISNGDDVDEAIYAMLNQAPITDILTISLANIVPGIDQTIDVKDDLENMTVKEGLDKLLLVSNSVLKITSQTVYVTSRDPGGSIAMTFYGQASQNGAENIIDIKNVSNGMNRLFNYFTWKDSTAGYSDGTSVAKYGARSKEIDFGIYTNTTKQTNFMTDLATEFKDPKQELDLVAPLDFDTLALNLLDRVSIDYPTIFEADEGESLPICGVAICGEAILPRGLWAFYLNSARSYKILRKDMNLTNMQVTLKLREI